MILYEIPLLRIDKISHDKPLSLGGFSKLRTLAMSSSAAVNLADQIQKIGVIVQETLCGLAHHARTYITPQFPINTGVLVGQVFAAKYLAGAQVKAHLKA